MVQKTDDTDFDLPFQIISKKFDVIGRNSKKLWSNSILHVHRNFYLSIYVTLFLSIYLSIYLSIKRKTKNNQQNKNQKINRLNKQKS